MTSFLQSSSWARFNEALGTAVITDQELAYIRRSFRLGTYFLTSRCSIPRDYLLPTFASKPCFVRFEPEDFSSLKNLEEFASRKRYALKPTLAVQPRQTVLIPLGSDEEILQSMKQKHRYNTRLSLKNNLSYEVCSSYDENMFDRFWLLLSRTAQRQGFRTHARDYYMAMMKTLGEAKIAHIIVVSHEGTDLAAMLLLTHDETATYLHGASDETHRSLMAPYFMHWQAMRLAKEHGCTMYDLWGSDLVRTAETWEPQEGHPSYGTSRFKAGFGGTVVEYPGTFDLILQPFCYNLYKTVRQARGGKRAFH
jgi:peptidoglycan pentaglycine glycine transferase (the first glycine)